MKDNNRISVYQRSRHTEKIYIVASTLTLLSNPETIKSQDLTKKPNLPPETSSETLEFFPEKFSRRRPWQLIDEENASRQPLVRRDPRLQEP